MFTVYKVSGPFTSSVYYGYSSGDEVKTGFLTGALRADGASANRGDYRMLDANKGNTETLQYALLDIYEDEFDAWCIRNDLRASDAQSITGPTMFPAGCARRVQTEQPDRLKQWSINSKLNKHATALEAYQDGAYTFAEVSMLCKKFGKTLIQRALTALTPAEFATQFINC